MYLLKIKSLNNSPETREKSRKLSFQGASFLSTMKYSTSGMNKRENSIQNGIVCNVFVSGAIRLETKNNIHPYHQDQIGLLLKKGGYQGGKEVADELGGFVFWVGPDSPKSQKVTEKERAAPFQTPQTLSRDPRTEPSASGDGCPD